MERLHLPNESSLLGTKGERVQVPVNNFNYGANVLFVDGIDDHAVIVNVAVRVIHGNPLQLDFQLS